jgi:hypothetical protein
MVNWYDSLYSLTQDTFSRTIIVNPVASQPGQPAYTIRGIYNSGLQNFMLEDQSLMADQQTIVDVEEDDCPGVPPAQNDIITIPNYPLTNLKALGDFEVTSATHNGAGEWTLQLKKVVP